MELAKGPWRWWESDRSWSGLKAQVKEPCLRRNPLQLCAGEELEEEVTHSRQMALAMLPVKAHASAIQYVSGEKLAQESDFG